MSMPLRTVSKSATQSRLGTILTSTETLLALLELFQQAEVARDFSHVAFVRVDVCGDLYGTYVFKRSRVSRQTGFSETRGRVNMGSHSASRQARPTSLMPHVCCFDKPPNRAFASPAPLARPFATSVQCLFLEAHSPSRFESGLVAPRIRPYNACFYLKTHSTMSGQALQIELTSLAQEAKRKNPEIRAVRDFYSHSCNARLLF